MTQLKCDHVNSVKVVETDENSTVNSLDDGVVHTLIHFGSHSFNPGHNELGEPCMGSWGDACVDDSPHVKIQSHQHRAFWVNKYLCCILSWHDSVNE